MENLDSGQEKEIRLAGFHDRLLASLIDSILIIFLISPMMRLFIHPPQKLYNLVVDFHNKLINEEQYNQQMIDYLYNQGGIGDLILDAILQFLFLGIIIIGFWIYKFATPGKMITKMRIVDEKSWQTPTKAQMVIRYLAYFVSAVPFLLGFLWIAFDKKKQGWHDKIAGTIVITEKKKK